MKLDKLTAISGLPGIYRMAGSRSNGAIIEDLDTGKKRFLASRKHQFLPLETISIFTYNDAESLADVFQKMLDMRQDNPPAPSSAGNEELRAYFSKVLPEHDENRVSVRDIKKIIKWFEFLDSRNLWNNEPEETPGS